MEEERARSCGPRRGRRAGGRAAVEGRRPRKEEAPAASTPKTPEAPDNEDAMDEDDALYQEPSPCR